MNSLNRCPLMRLALSSLLARGSCWLLLAAGLLFSWFSPWLTPWDENPRLLQPARVQACWIYLWAVAATWLPYQSARIGSQFSKSGILEHLSVSGMRAPRMLFEMASAVLIWTTSALILLTLLMAYSCSPSRMAEAELWLTSLIQQVLLYALVTAPLSVIPASLATRFSHITASLMTTAVFLMGFTAHIWLYPITGQDNWGFLSSLWLAIPHYHLADLTDRLVFKMGPLEASVFVKVMVTLFLQGMTLIAASLWLFRKRH